MSKLQKNKKSKETEEVENSATKHEISEREIKRKLKEKCIKSKNGCLIWNGSMNDGVCRLYYHGDQINIKKALWDFKYSDNKMDSKHKLTNTCENKRCVNIDHIRKESFKQMIDKQKLWREMRKHGERIKKTEATKKLGIGCLEWTKSNLKGYGVRGVGGKTPKIHRLSYWIHSEYENLEDIPHYEDPVKKLRKIVVNHKCDNPKCFEPTHLELGPHKNGMHEDKIRHGTLGAGEDCTSAKISKETALKIKHSKYPKGHKKYKTQKQRAKMFDVEYTIVKDIDARITWKKLPDRHGIVDTKKDDNERKRKMKEYINARDREWTEEMYKKAHKDMYAKAPLGKEVTSKTKRIKTPCRIMPGYRDKDGYAKMRSFGYQWRVNVLACMIKNRRKAKTGERASHKCGNRDCCRLSHVDFGSHKQDAIDKVNDGNQRNAKLTEKQVLEIRNTKGKDGLTQKERAEKYGNISVSHLRRIELKEKWGHVKEPKKGREDNVVQDE